MTSESEREGRAEPRKQTEGGWVLGTRQRPIIAGNGSREPESAGWTAEPPVEQRLQRTRRLPLRRVPAGAAAGEAGACWKLGREPSHVPKKALDAPRCQQKPRHVLLLSTSEKPNSSSRSAL